ncbi:unnamed protein product [Cylindrotheca closterium]|uniref:Uncharacterized protein n=1 Tax=Cylindrotheca closterium TaxID=2856 RepID=A0AAD2CRA7_9STRA|nr:unnamed protein product [Cylindrotheca closterium]
MASQNASDLPNQEKLQGGKQAKPNDDAETSWDAVLPYTGLLGREDESVDLFSFVTNDVELRNGQFDRKQWPPTKAGLRQLLSHLQEIAIQHGSDFNVDISRGGLICKRCRKNHTEKKNEIKQKKRKQSDDHDEPTKTRAIHTSKDNTSENNKFCNCRIRMLIHKQDKPDGYIYVSCKGVKCHIYHPREDSKQFSFKLNQLLADQQTKNLRIQSRDDIQTKAMNIHRLCGTNQKSANIVVATMAELERFLNQQKNIAAAKAQQARKREADSAAALLTIRETQKGSKKARKEEKSDCK